MQNKTLRITAFFVALTILTGSVLILIEHLNFFINKKETSAKILSIDDLGHHEPYKITLSYFDASSDKDIISIVLLKKSYGNRLKKENSDFVKIHYVSNYRGTVYLADYQSPNIGIIIFDLIAITLMGLTVFAFKDAFKKKHVTK